jgi:hypothetical protein
MMRTVKISKRPIIINTANNHFPNGGIISKLSIGPTLPMPGPTLPMEVATAPNPRPRLSLPAGRRAIAVTRMKVSNAFVMQKKSVF